MTSTLSAARVVRSIRSTIGTCREIVIGSFAAFALTMALTISASAATLSPSDFGSMLGEVKSSVQEMEDAKQEVKDVQQAGMVLKQKIDQHNANRCVANQPGQCNWYDQEKASLDAEKADLIQRLDTAHQRWEYAKSRYQVVIGKMRISVFLGCLQPFTAEIRSCAAMSDEAAAECLSEVWENHC